MVPGVFYGMNLQNVYGFGYGIKAGAQYKASDMVTLGLVYTSKSTLDFKHGDMTFAGAGKYSAEVEGFNWPQSVGAGVAVGVTSGRGVLPLAPGRTVASISSTMQVPAGVRRTAAVTFTSFL